MTVPPRFVLAARYLGDRVKALADPDADIDFRLWVLRDRETSGSHVRKAVNLTVLPRLLLEEIVLTPRFLGADRVYAASVSLQDDRGTAADTLYSWFATTEDEIVHLLPNSKRAALPGGYLIQLTADALQREMDEERAVALSAAPGSRCTWRVEAGNAIAYEGFLLRDGWGKDVGKRPFSGEVDAEMDDALDTSDIEQDADNVAVFARDAILKYESLFAEVPRMSPTKQVRIRELLDRLILLHMANFESIDVVSPTHVQFPAEWHTATAYCRGDDEDGEA